MPAQLDPQVVAPLVLTGGLGFLLVQLALRMRALEARRPRRRCPSCHRIREEIGQCPCRR